jgi:cytochrome c2
MTPSPDTASIPAAPAAPAPRQRRPWLWALAGCGALLACAVLACALNSLYWTVRMAPVIRAQGQGAGSGAAPAAEAPAPDALQAELDALPAGDPADGERVFTGDGGCSACHSLEPGRSVVGPSLAGVGERAAERRPGYSAELYLYEAIVYPGAFAADGYSAQIMPAHFGASLSDQQLADLIAWLRERER